MDKYRNNYNRVRYIVDFLDKEHSYSKLPGSPTLMKCLKNHKYYIRFDNPLQILVAEGLYKLKLIFEYENKNYMKLR